MSTNPPYPSTTNPPSLVAIVIQYDGLLQRYARRMVHNDTIASIIVLEAFQSCYENLAMPIGVELRKALPAETLRLCNNWLKYFEVGTLKDPLFLAKKL